MRQQSFDRFYLEKIAIGEGCGCAEQAIGMLDMERRAKKAKAQRSVAPTQKKPWSRVLDRLCQGLNWRHR